MRPFTYLKGGAFRGDADILVDDIYAGTHHSKVGDKVDLLNHSFRIAGIVAHGKGARLFLPLSTLQGLTGAQGRASAFYVKADSPANADAVVSEIKDVPNMSTYFIRSMREYLSMMTPDNYPGLSTFITIVVGISVTIGFIVIFQAM